MLTRYERELYEANGYLMVEDAVTPEQVQELRRVAYEFIERSRYVTQSNDVFDLDEGHTREKPKLTRIKLPHKQHPLFWQTVRSERILDVLRSLLGPSVAL